jgi:hypothetical protein
LNLPNSQQQPLVRNIKKIVVYGLVYGICGGLLIVVLKLIEYRFLVVQHSVEIYGGLIALVFPILGIWVGIRLTRKEEVVVVKEVAVLTSRPFALNEDKVRELSVTRRELQYSS